MVHVSEETMARLKKQPANSLEMTEYERNRVGSMFRIQIPIVDRPTLRDQAALLRQLADRMDAMGTRFDIRDFDVMNVLKGHVLSTNHSLRLTRSRFSGKPLASDETQ